MLFDDIYLVSKQLVTIPEQEITLTIFAVLTTVRRRADEKWWLGCGQPETVAASR